MFDIGFWEFALIGVIVLVVVGPNNLPKMASTVGIYLGKARRMMADVKAEVKRELKKQELADLAELKQLKQEFDRDINEATGKIRNVTEDIEKGIQKGIGDIEEDLGVDAMQASFKEAKQALRGKDGEGDTAGTKKRKPARRKKPTAKPSSAKAAGPPPEQQPEPKPEPKPEQKAALDPQASRVDAPKLAEPSQERLSND